MKRFIPILFAAAAFAACEKDPDLDNLDNQYLVVTDYDSEAPFAAFRTYYLPDSILVIGSDDESKYDTPETSEGAARVLAAFRDNLNALYTEAPDKAAADVGLQVSYVASTYYFTAWDGNPWWSGYPGYWNYGYWGGWGGWYYPYPVTFSYSTGSFVAELVNLLPHDETGEKKLSVVWSCGISGLLDGSGSLSLAKTVAGIDQAFLQSPYLKK